MKLNREEKFILSLVILVVLSLFIIKRVNLFIEQEVETAYEAGYTASLDDTKHMLNIIETFELYGEEQILIQFQDGETHLYTSPKAN